MDVLGKYTLQPYRVFESNTLNTATYGILAGCATEIGALQIGDGYLSLESALEAIERFDAQEKEEKI